MNTPNTLTTGRDSAPDYYIGRFTRGEWVRVVPNHDRSVLKLEWPKREWPYGQENGKGGAA